MNRYSQRLNTTKKFTKGDLERVCGNVTSKLPKIGDEETAKNEFYRWIHVETCKQLGFNSQIVRITNKPLYHSYMKALDDAISKNREQTNANLFDFLKVTEEYFKKYSKSE